VQLHEKRAQNGNILGGVGVMPMRKEPKQGGTNGPERATSVDKIILDVLAPSLILKFRQHDHNNFVVTPDINYLVNKHLNDDVEILVHGARYIRG